MKVLLDTCIAAQAAEVVRQAGHDISVSIAEPGNYKIVIYIDRVEPESLPWRFDRR